jgi:hypothetical protein
VFVDPPAILNLSYPFPGPETQRLSFAIPAFTPRIKADSPCATFSRNAENMIHACIKISLAISAPNMQIIADRLQNNKAARISILNKDPKK